MGTGNSGKSMWMICVCMFLILYFGNTSSNDYIICTFWQRCALRFIPGDVFDVIFHVQVGEKTRMQKMSTIARLRLAGVSEC